MPQPEPTLPCVLVIPAHNEERAIARALDAVHAGALPDGFAWRAWVVVDDGSVDGTVRVVREWAARHPEIPLRLQSDGARLGKTARLEQVHRALVSGGDLDAVCVGLDADSVPDRGAVAALVAPFAARPELAMSSGLDLPAGRRFGTRASVFQRTVTARLARSCGAAVPRAVGRLYAYRVAALRDFHWRDGSMGDDVQMAAWVQGRGLPFLSVWDAVVRMQPAASWRDFYRQTYRARVAGRVLAAMGVAAPRPAAARRLRAFARTAAADPLGAGAYLVARAVAAGMHRVRPAAFRAAWEISPSTKTSVNA